MALEFVRTDELIPAQLSEFDNEKVLTRKMSNSEQH